MEYLLFALIVLVSTGTESTETDNTKVVEQNTRSVVNQATPAKSSVVKPCQKYRLSKYGYYIARLEHKNHCKKEFLISDLSQDNSQRKIVATKVNLECIKDV